MSERKECPLRVLAGKIAEFAQDLEDDRVIIISKTDISDNVSYSAKKEEIDGYFIYTINREAFTLW